ncbi:MAG: hypothetical protein WC856_26805 [Methylococcaceae bacterium]|jgi:hypothetical protein
MKMKKYDVFIKEHDRFFTFISSTPSKPKTGSVDKKKRKIPTPFMTFRKWCEDSLQNDWTQLPINKGFVINVTNKKDADLMVNKFTVTSSNPEKSQYGENSYGLNYNDKKYIELLQIQGFELY